MVKSPIKIIDSGTAPTTANLSEGQIAFGTVDGATKLYGSDGTTVTDLTASGGQGPQGPEGPQGPQGEQGPQGPQGEPGAAGAAATITVGTTTTGEAGTDATVTNSGTTSAAVLNFTIPKGEKGDKGDKGDAGPAGANGADGAQGPQGPKGDTGNTGPAGTTTFAGLTDQPTDNAALKTALDAKADQTAVDSLTTTVNGKVSSITAGEGISITGTATEPVISATGGTVISGFRLDYANAQTVSIEALTSWTSPSDGYFVVATWVGVPGPGGRTSFTVNGASVVDPNYGASASALPDLPTYLPLSKGDVIATEFESGVRGTFYPLKNSTVTPNEFTDTGWLDISNSSGDGLKYLVGPWTVGNTFRIRKFGKHVTVSGQLTCTEDISLVNGTSANAQFDEPPGTTTSASSYAMLNIPPSDSNYNSFNLPDNGDVTGDQFRSAGDAIYVTAGNLATSPKVYCLVSIVNHPKSGLGVSLIPIDNFSSGVTAFPNGTTINLTFSWDTED